MKIGIDISQTAYKNTGVARIISNLVKNLIEIDEKNEYILFFSSLRKNLKPQILSLKDLNQNVKIKTFRIPPSVLDVLWNRLHIFSIEKFIGDVDVFITSDWTEPPARKAKKITILYDLIVYKYPEETHSRTEFNPFKFIISPNIVESQKRKLKWVKKESDLILCISEATKKDAMEILGLDERKFKVIYPGVLC